MSHASEILYYIVHSERWTGSRKRLNRIDQVIALIITHNNKIK